MNGYVVSANHARQQIAKEKNQSVDYNLDDPNEFNKARLILQMENVPGQSFHVYKQTSVTITGGPVHSSTV